MIKKKILLLVVLFLFLNSILFIDVFGKEATDEQKVYFNLYSYYYNWQHSLFGSNKSNRRFLYRYLVKIIGKKIETPFDFYLDTPFLYSKIHIYNPIKKNDWLKFHGDVNLKGIKDLINKNPDLMHSWWRKRIFVSVSGKIKRFRISRDPLGDTVELYLDKITVKVK